MTEKKSTIQSEGDASVGEIWEEETRAIDRVAFWIFTLRTSLVFWGRPPDEPLTVETEFDRKHPPTRREKELVERWHSFPQEQREAALERALIHFVGGTLERLRDHLRERPIGTSSRPVKNHWRAEPLP